MNLIPRDNAVHKQLQFLRCINSRLVEIDHLNELLENTDHGPWGSAFLSFLVNQQDTIDAAPFFWAALVTTILCITYGYNGIVPTEQEDGSIILEGGESYGEYPGASIAVHVIGLLCVLCSFVLALKHFVVIVPYQVRLWMKAESEADDALFNLDGLNLHQVSLQ